MRFLADIPIGRVTIDHLTRHGHDVVRVSDRYHFMLRENVVGNQADDPRIEVEVLGKADELNADLLVGLFESLCQNSGQPQGYFRILCQ